MDYLAQSQKGLQQLHEMKLFLCVYNYTCCCIQLKKVSRLSWSMCSNAPDVTPIVSVL